jgi:uncharacterized DUF497 family protein
MLRFDWDERKNKRNRTKHGDLYLLDSAKRRKKLTMKWVA